MATNKEFVDYLLEQLKMDEEVTVKKMFGEYGLYINGKIVGLICDNQVFVKPTVGGRTFIGEVTEAPAYPGAKNSFLVNDHIDDGEWLAELLRISWNELPEAKPKKPKKK